MKKYFFIIIIIFCSCRLSFSQETGFSNQEKDAPKIIRLALPSYPVSGFAINAEEKIVAKLQINKSGEIISYKFKAKFPPFGTVIKSALKEWKFEKSEKEIAEVTMNFEFILLPTDSKNNVTAIFEFPNTVKIYEKKRILIDSSSR